MILGKGVNPCIINKFNNEPHSGGILIGFNTTQNI